MIEGQDITINLKDVMPPVSITSTVRIDDLATLSYLIYCSCLQLQLQLIH